MGQNLNTGVLLMVFLFIYFAADGPSLLGLSHISNISMNVNETAMTTATMSRVEPADPVDTFDAAICPADDLLDGCKVSLVLQDSLTDLLLLHPV